jgi:hypothetical protein
MKLRRNLMTLFGLWIAAVLLLVPSAVALAQDERPTPSPAAMGAFIMVMVVIGLAFYVYMALALQTIATKTHTENAWLAWIPIANIILMLNIAGKPIWWIVLMLIPLVNIVIAIIVWMAVAEARGKPSWWGILMIVPLVNFIVPGYLAWSD